jgi:hypothetical protein
MPRYAHYLKVTAVLWFITFTPLVLFYLFAVRPRALTLEKMQAAVSAKEEEYQRLRKAKSPRETARADAELERLAAQHAALLLPGGELSGLDLTISELAQERQLGMFSSKMLFGGSNPDLARLEHIAERNFRISFEADFPSTLRFLNDLERHHPAIFVDEFTLNRDMEDESRLLAEMHLAVLYEKQK